MFWCFVWGSDSVCGQFVCFVWEMKRLVMNYLVKLNDNNIAYFINVEYAKKFMYLLKDKGEVILVNLNTLEMHEAEYHD